MDSTKPLPSPKNPPHNRSLENRSLAKPPSPAIAPRLIREVLALPPPPPSPPIDNRSELEEVPLSPAAAVSRSTRPELVAKADGGGRSWVGRSEREEVALSPVMVVNRANREEMGAVTKVEGGVEGGGWRSRGVASILRRSRHEAIVQKAALGFRVLGVIFCLISFSVMAADKTQGWAGDSFERYKEYRFCLSMTVIGFVYSGFQAYGLTQHLVTGKHVIRHPIRYYFDFSMDQILAYLLMSASSSAATRTDSWVSNWGEDEFTKMATASIGMSFLAFIAFAFSALISGYNLCNGNS